MRRGAAQVQRNRAALSHSNRIHHSRSPLPRVGAQSTRAALVEALAHSRAIFGPRPRVSADAARASVPHRGGVEAKFRSICVRLTPVRLGARAASGAQVECVAGKHSTMLEGSASRSATPRPGAAELEFESAAERGESALIAVLRRSWHCFGIPVRHERESGPPRLLGVKFSGRIDAASPVLPGERRAVIPGGVITDQHHDLHLPFAFSPLVQLETTRPPTRRVRFGVGADFGPGSRTNCVRVR